MRVVGKLLPIFDRIKINQSFIIIDQNVNFNSTKFSAAILPFPYAWFIGKIEA